MTKVEQLAVEGHGAIQVEESLIEVPPIVFLAGPIKIWWQEGMWDSPMHKRFLVWRSALETAFVKAGFAVYMPHKAIRGRWNGALQRINDKGIEICDVMVYTTPHGIIADGTDGEIALGMAHKKHILHAPPGTESDINRLINTINELTKIN